MNNPIGPIGNIFSARGTARAALYAAIFCLVAAAGFSAPARAEQGQPAVKSRQAIVAKGNLRNPEIRKFERDGGKVDYLGSAYGLDGWIMFDRTGNFRSVVYSTKDGGLIRGALFGPDGKSVTKMQMEAYNARKTGAQGALPNADNPDSGLPKSEYFYAALEKANWVKVGKDGAPYLYILINVNCDHCQQLWKSLEPDEKAGKIQVRILPFGKADKNLNGGAALLSVEDPGIAWDRYIDGHKGALGVRRIKTGAVEKMKANNAFVAKWKPRATPMMIYRRLTDGKLTAIAGKPDNPMLVMSELMKTN